MISLHQSLPPIAFSRNIISLILISDDYLPGVPAAAVNQLEFTGAIAVDAEVTVTWEKGSVTMVAAAMPDESGLTFPAGDGGGVHVATCEEYFQAQYLIDRDFIVAVAGTSLLFTSREKGPEFNFNAGAAGNIHITVQTPGVTGKVKSNFMHHQQVVVRDAADTTGLQAYDANVALDEPLTGKTTVDIGGEVLHSFLTPDYPVLNTLYERCTNSIRSYFCKYAQFFGSNPTVKKLYRTDAAFVTMGGLRIQAASIRTLIAELCPSPGHPEENRCLRQGSKNKLARTDQPEWLTFLNLSAAPMVAALEVTIYNDGEDPFTFNAVEGLEIPAYAKYQFQTGFAQLGITGRQAAGLRPTYYTCRIKDAGGYRSAAYAYVIDYAWQEWPRYFVYWNSLGAFQTIATTGKGQAEFNRTKDDARLTGDQARAAISGDFLECNISIQEKRVVAHGYRYAGKRNTALLRDFLLSPAIYIWENSALVPIGISTNNLKDGLDGVGPYANTFEYYPKYAEVNYTEEPAADDDINELLGAAGSPPPPPVDPGELEGGHLVVEYGDIHLGMLDGHQTYTAPYRLAGKAGYRIYSTQFGRYFYTSEITYNMPGGSFAILVEEFALSMDNQLIVWPYILNPDE